MGCCSLPPSHNMMLADSLSAVLLVLFSQFFDPDPVDGAITAEVSLIAPQPRRFCGIPGWVPRRSTTQLVRTWVTSGLLALAFRVMEDCHHLTVHCPPSNVVLDLPHLMPYLFIPHRRRRQVRVTTVNALIDALEIKNKSSSA
jgi:hypothetical protein